MSVHVSKAVTPSGQWNIYVKKRDMTFFRGLPVTVKTIADTDPFGPSTAAFTLPQVSPLEPVGAPGTDLEWLRPDTFIEFVYTLDEQHVNAARRMGFGDKYYWQGFITSFSYASQQGETSVSVECQGALRVLNNILAMDEQVSRPYPYEHAIKHAIDGAIVRLGEKAGPLGDRSLDISVFEKLEWWPESLRWNDAAYAAKYPGQWWMIPMPGTVENGKKWSGMLTREMGKQDKTLSSYVDGMLKTMYTERGRFSIRVKPGTWQPELFHQDLIGYSKTDESKMLHIDSVWPGVSFQLEHDYSQTVTTIYGNATGTGIDGSNYTGEEFTSDGSGTWFQPFADSLNAQQSMMRREKFMQFNDGLSVADALQVSSEHISRNVEPGYTGNITLTGVDPKVYDTSIDNQTGGELVPFPHHFIRAGMTIRLHGFGGRKSGMTFFVAECTHDVSGNSVSMQVDTKFRDYVTVQEVRARGRDAMAPIRLMTPGSYSPSAKDRLSPWDSTKSGMIPMNSWSIWQTAEGRSNPVFPWLDLVKKYPPSSHPEFYTRIKGKDYGNGAQGAHLSVEQVDQFWASHIRNGDTKDVSREFTHEYELQGEKGELFGLQYPLSEAIEYQPDGSTKEIEYDPVIGDRLMGSPGRAPKTEHDYDLGEPETMWVYHPPKITIEENDKGEEETTVEPNKSGWHEHKINNTPTKGDRYQCPVEGYEDTCEQSGWGTTYWQDVEESTVPNWIENSGSMMLASSGNITAVRMMCVDVNGNPLPVTYHLSLYSRKNVQYSAMPQLPGPYPEEFNNNRDVYDPQFEDSKNRYLAQGSRYPFFPFAWEERLPDGSKYGNSSTGDQLGRVPNDQNLLKAFGSYWERPGTFPWRLQEAAAYTNGVPRWNGLFSWDGEIGFSTALNDSVPPSTDDVREHTQGGYMIYCDDFPGVDKYFIGRLYVDQRGR